VNFLLALPEPSDEEAVATQRFLNRFREELDLLNKYLLSGSARSSSMTAFISDEVPSWRFSSRALENELVTNRRR
jgi:hypothetical protein